MYLNILQETEKKAFLQLAAHIIKSDKKIEDTEIAMFNAMKIELQFPNFNFVEEFADIKSVCSNFKSHQSKIAVLIELIGLSYSDGEFAKEELEIISEVAQIFEIKEDLIIEIQNWVIKMVDLTNQGYCFFSKNL